SSARSSRYEPCSSPSTRAKWRSVYGSAAWRNFDKAFLPTSASSVAPISTQAAMALCATALVRLSVFHDVTAERNATAFVVPASSGAQRLSPAAPLVRPVQPQAVLGRPQLPAPADGPLPLPGAQDLAALPLVPRLLLPRRRVPPQRDGPLHAHAGDELAPG